MTRLNQKMFVNIKPQFHLIPHLNLKEILTSSDAADILWNFSKKPLPIINKNVLIDFAIVYTQQNFAELCLVSNESSEYLGLLANHHLQRENVVEKTKQYNVVRTELTVAQLMDSTEELGAIDYNFVQQASMFETLELLNDSQKAYVFVVDGDDIVGLISVFDICQYLNLSRRMTYATNSFKKLWQKL